MFTIACPQVVFDSTLDLKIDGMASDFSNEILFSYDVRGNTALPIALPVVSVVPAACFTIQSYKVIEKDSGSEVTYLSISMTDDQMLVDSSDRGLVG